MGNAARKARKRAGEKIDRTPPPPEAQGISSMMSRWERRQADTRAQRRIKARIQHANAAKRARDAT